MSPSEEQPQPELTAPAVGRGRRLQPFVENVSEATAACLVTMVQGNLLALGLSHWIIASQTGLLAGTAASVAIFLAKARNPWVVSTTLGAMTSLADYWLHPGMFGPFFLEAVVTGLGAGVLSLAVHWLLGRFR